MPDIPSVFSRLDFIGLLLPGYVVIITYIGLLRADLILGKATLSFDVFSAIIFLVAGPAAGIGLRQIHHAVKALVDSRFGRSRTYMKDLEWYAKIRLKMSDSEKAEVDEVLAYYDCSTSLGMGFFLVDATVFLSRGLADPRVITLLAVAAVLFFLTAYYAKKANYRPLLRELAIKLHS